MATTTYVPLITQTLNSSASSVTLGSGGTISQAYTDLVLIVNAAVTSGVCNLTMTFGDTSTLYSRTQLTGNGSTATSARATGEAFAYVCAVTTTYSTNGIVQIMNYANTNTYKTWLSRDTYPAGSVIQRVGLWRNTNAITSIVIGNDGGTSFAAGSTFTLYGIANADTGALATGGVITYDST